MMRLGHSIKAPRAHSSIDWLLLNIWPITDLAQEQLKRAKDSELSGLLAVSRNAGFYFWRVTGAWAEVTRREITLKAVT